MQNNYRPQEIEPKWQDVWQKDKLYEVDLTLASSGKLPKFYVFAMFNYPSGEGIHVGHVKNFTISDVLARFHRQDGELVYSPVGFDAFGLPAENFALKTGTSPQATIETAMANYIEQYRACGFSFDWSKVINTSQPEYYRWTQWCFLQLYKAGLAYQKEGSQWWCQACQTVLADGQVTNGKCWRHDKEDDLPIGRKSLKQWFFKMTEYVEEILADTAKLNWTPWVKAAQENYIGKSKGFEVKFALQGLNLQDQALIVFTTALETIYGATFMVLAPEHPLVVEILEKASNADELREYVRRAQTKSELARTQAKVKTGIMIQGLNAVNPLTKTVLTVWLADYVLVNYGRGAIMAVPGADERDLEFAQIYNLPIVYVTQTQAFVACRDICQNPQKHRLATNDNLNGLTMAKAKPAIFKQLKAAKMVREFVNYKLRDWLISRQRYWGAPIPIIHCAACGVVPVPENQLPIELPIVQDYKPTGDGQSPLAKINDWVEVKCPKCGQMARRETDTMDTFICSSWYFMRYLSPHNDQAAWDVELVNDWMPVDFYNGGDHVTAHLLYARFFTRFFYKQGLIKTPEPFARMYFHAKIAAPDGEHFSKSSGNGISPQEIIEQGYGADALRVYICAMAPPDMEVVWRHDGVPAAYRFLSRIWVLVSNYLKNRLVIQDQKIMPSEVLLGATHRCILKTREDIGRFKFNTALAAQMELVNTFYKFAEEDNFKNPAWQFCLESLVLILAPFAPHLSSELWQNLGHLDSPHINHWPKVDERYLSEAEVTIVIQIDGKLRDRFQITAGAKQEVALRLAKERPKIEQYLKSARLVKEIYIQDKLVNFATDQSAREEA